MTKRHKIIFFFFFIWLWLIGIRPGRVVKDYSEVKGKYIVGHFVNCEGNSVSRSKLDIGMSVMWLEPFEGEDYRYYMQASYKLKDFLMLWKTNKITEP